jgi:hypothetical protein
MVVEIYQFRLKFLHNINSHNFKNEIMKKILIFLLYFGVWLKADAQNIVQYEYWYDSNYSSSIVVNTSPTSTFDLSTSLTGTSGLTFGLHAVNFRAKDDNGKWSSVITEQFYSTGNFNVVSYEYWFDNDYASKITSSISPTQTYILASAFNTTGIGFGLHALNFRSKDSNGRWSSTIKEHFYASGNLNIDGYEYWFDDNYAAKITNTVAPSQTLILTSNFDTSAAGYGLHALNFRSKDSAGKWSIVIKEFFYKSVGGTQLTNAEYWIDANFANRQPLAFTSSDVVFINQSVLTSNLDDQLHTFNFRMQDQGGKWSVVTSSYFMAQSLIVGYDYWFDDNFAQKTSVAITPTNLLTSQLDFNASTLSNGIHIVHFRAKNNSGKYSSTISQTFTVNITDAYSITASAGSNGSISPNGVTNVTAGLNQVYTITPNTCYQIADVVVDGVSQGAITTYTFTNVTTTHTISATFISSSITYYQDADGDGYGNPAVTVLACVAPIGYVAIGTDCDDTKATIHPGAIDVCYDGIDNDCNGNIDNVGLPGGCIPIVTTLPTATCGSTISNLSVTITASYYVGAQGYRFRVKNLNTNAVQIVDRPVNSFALSNLPGITLGTPYQIDVALKVFNVWQPYYGSPCTVNTPSPLCTIGTQCNTTLTSMTQFVYCTYISNVTGYRFKITNLLTNAVQILDQGLNRFSFSQLANRSFNTQYLIEVALKNTDGNYLPYSTGCTITTPSFPTSEVRLSQCDYTALSNTENFVATLVSGATQYRFLIYNVSLGYSYSIDRPVNTFNLNMFPGLTSGATYSVQVAVKIGSEFGPYGKICNLTTPGGARTVTDVKASNTFNVIAFPNPFAAGFSLAVKTSAQSTIQIRVFDMLGKLIENKNVEASDVENLEIGTNYPSGVYNVIVNQEDNTQTLRVIKR